MAKLEVSLLGRFAVRSDGNSVDIQSHAAQSLFAYLILNSKLSHRRELLAGMFWPDSDETNARSNLRHALWRIRSGIGEDIFETDKTVVSLVPELDYSIDVAALEVLKEQDRDVASLLKSADLYQGDLLPGFYDDWVILQREWLRGAYAQLMERLLESLIEEMRWEEVTEWAGRWIAMGHVPEPAFRALMVAHAARGDQAGVAAVYQRCVETLKRELGVEPSPQTLLLHEQLKKGSLPLVTAPTKERYEIGDQIGRGGMGEVYQANDTWLERAVAVKVLSSESLGPEGRERLLSEAQAAARLNHPNVVSVYDVREIDDEPFIVMELVEGETLHDHRPESQAEILSIVLEICAALEHAHAQGIVHRDLKPENVMLAPDGMARLMDFGLASRTIEVPQAPEGNTAGTVYYLAPEVFQGEPASVQSDLYALGVMLYELLTGDLPFSGDDPMAVISQHLEAEPKPPSELNSEIRPALEALILRLLSKKPVDRPLSAAAVAEVLEAVAPEEIQLGEPAPGEPPFKGLEYYDVEDADIFFGREALVERLMDRLRDERFLAVIVGASGSGKSSIARAGLVPAFSDGDWIFRLMTPTERPLQALSETLVPRNPSEAETAPTAEELAQNPAGLDSAAQWLVETEGAKKLLLVVDQLEELFTLCDDETERSAFIENLLTAVDFETTGPTVVVITLRADFYPHCAAYPALREALARNQEYIGPMSTSELRRAIEEPALRGGWKFQAGLVDLMLRDVRGEPGALPLLSHALLETWKRRSRRTLTLRGYAEAGGVRRAIARTAENVYHYLSENQQAIARNLFLRLTELGEGTEDTRRRVTHTELIQVPGQNDSTEQALATLAEARLLTLSEEHVEVAHEALIREWPRLREWLDEDRDGLRIHRHLTEAAQAWEGLDRDPGELYRGGRLAQAIEWSVEQQPELNPLEFEFLEASQALAEQREAEREAQIKRLRRRAIYLVGALVAAVGLAFAAVSFGRQASDSAAQADLSLSTAQVANTETAAEAMTRATAEAVAVERQGEAEVQAQLARSKELAAAAVSVLNENPELSMLLALQSIEETPPESTESASGVLALREAMQANQLVWRYTATGDRGFAQITPDGSRIYMWYPSDGAVTAIDVETGNVAWVHQELNRVDSFGHLAVSPDGGLIAFSMFADWSIQGTGELSDDPSVGQEPSRVVLLRASDGQVETVLYPSGGCPANELPPNAFSPDGRWFMVRTGNEQCGPKPESDWISVYDTATWEEAYRLAAEGGEQERATFTASSDQIFLTSLEGPAKLLSFPELEPIRDFGDVGFAAISPDGMQVAMVLAQLDPNFSYRPIVVDATSGQQLFYLDGVDDLPSGAAIQYSPEGSRIVVTTWGHDYIFDAQDGRLLSDLGEPGTTFSTSLTADAHQLLTVTNNHALLWDVSDVDITTGIGTLIQFSETDAVWINPNLVLDGPNLAVQALSFDGALGFGVSVGLMDETGRVVSELNGVGEQLRDGRLVVNVTVPEEDNRRYGPLVIWNPDSDSIIELTQCTALESALDYVNPIECPSGEPVFGSPEADRSIVTSFDGSRFVTEGYSPVGTENPVWVWSADTLQVLSKFDVGSYEVVSIAGTSWVGLLDWGSESIVIRDLSSGDVIADLRPDIMTYVVELSHDGSQLYAAGVEGDVWVFDTSTWKVAANWHAHDGKVRGLAVSPEGERLVTTANDDFAKVWDVQGIGDRPSVVELPPLLDRIPAPKPSDAAWLDEDTIALFLAAGPKWMMVSLSVGDLVVEARSQLTRSLTVGECATYQIDPCPTLDEIKGG